jgi:hypothetical protein
MEIGLSTLRSDSHNTGRITFGKKEDGKHGCY